MEMKRLIVWLVFVLAFGWSWFLWVQLTPDREPETAEQKKLRSYYGCVQTTYLQGGDIENCNKIK